METHNQELHGLQETTQAGFWIKNKWREWKQQSSRDVLQDAARQKQAHMSTWAMHLIHQAYTSFSFDSAHIKRNTLVLQRCLCFVFFLIQWLSLYSRILESLTAALDIKSLCVVTHCCFWTVWQWRSKKQYPLNCQMMQVFPRLWSCK